MAVLHDLVAGLLLLLASIVSLLGGYEISAQRIVSLEPVSAVILFGGDMMFDRSIRAASEVEGQDYILSCIVSEFDAVDLVVANLEGPITSNPSVSMHSKVGEADNFIFTFPLATADLLARHNIRVVNLGNNHILNFGTRGERETLGALQRASVNYFGDTLSQGIATTSIRGLKFAFVNFNQFSETSSKDTTIAQIRDSRAQGYTTIVYAHWGEEYVAANEMQKKHARAFVDSGAEVVIGSHPHVIQEHEIYKGKHIYYSLGNLIFDQYWNEEVRTGLLVAISFSEQGVDSVREIKTHLERDRRTCAIVNA